MRIHVFWEEMQELQEMPKQSIAMYVSPTLNKNAPARLELYFGYPEWVCAYLGLPKLDVFDFFLECLDLVGGLIWTRSVWTLCGY